MAANVTFKLALYSSDLQTDVLNLSITNTLSSATQGGFLRADIDPTASTGIKIADQDSFTNTSKVYLYNASTNSGAASRIFISFDAGATAHMVLEAGEWALVPWTGNLCPKAADRLDIHVWAQTEFNTLEYGVFDV